MVAIRPREGLQKLFVIEIRLVRQHMSDPGKELRMWLLFCDEYDRCPLTSKDGDVFLNVGYLSLENHITAVSLLQYITTLSPYYDL